MIYIRNIVFLIGMVIICAGCNGTFFKKFNINRPDAPSVSVDASQRLVIVNDMGGGGSDERRRVICAEPSPDAITAFAASGYAKLNVGSKGGELGGALTKAASKITERTQTIQLLRDAMYRACEAYMNGAIKDDDYHRIMVGYDELLITLLALESFRQPSRTDSRSVSAEMPMLEKPGSDTAEPEKPASNTAASKKPDSSTAASKKPASNAAEPEKPTSNVAGSKKPASNAAGSKKPASNTAEPEKSASSTAGNINDKMPGSTTWMSDNMAQRIQDIVRNYYCFQLALKQLYYRESKSKQSETKQSETKQSEPDSRRKIDPRVIATLCPGTADPGTAEPGTAEQ